MRTGVHDDSSNDPVGLPLPGLFTEPVMRDSRPWVPQTSFPPVPDPGRGSRSKTTALAHPFERADLEVRRTAFPFGTRARRPPGGLGRVCCVVAPAALGRAATPDRQSVASRASPGGHGRAGTGGRGGHPPRSCSRPAACGEHVDGRDRPQLEASVLLSPERPERPVRCRLADRSARGNCDWVGWGYRRPGGGGLDWGRARGAAGARSPWFRTVWCSAATTAS